MYFSMNIREKIVQKLYEYMSTEDGVHDEVNDMLCKAESVVCMGISEFGEEHDKRLDVLVGLERAAFMAGANMVLDFISGKERM